MPYLQLGYDMIRDFIVVIRDFIVANRAMIFAAVVVGVGACGTYLMLPHRHGLARPRAIFGAGVIAAALGLLGFVSFWSPPGPFLATVFLYIFGVTSIIGGLLTVTSRNPVYSALWFASVVLSTAGLFLLADAPFLAAGTIIVYAGAIIVTFLFVIMLAQM
jgi:NADH-quinone oxidoreductase subunit J